MALNPQSPKIQKILALADVTFDEIDEIDNRDEDYTDWKAIAHLAICSLDLPDQELWLEGLKGQKIETAQDVIDCLEWHLDQENLDHVRGA